MIFTICDTVWTNTIKLQFVEKLNWQPYGKWAFLSVIFKCFLFYLYSVGELAFKRWFMMLCLPLSFPFYSKHAYNAFNGSSNQIKYIFPSRRLCLLEWEENGLYFSAEGCTLNAFTIIFSSYKDECVVDVHIQWTQTKKCIQILSRPIFTLDEYRSGIHFLWLLVAPSSSRASCLIHC